MTSSSLQKQRHGPLIAFDYRGLRKVISGGQCGADRAGITAARDHQIKTGGYAPHGWRTHHGPRPDLVEFGLIEHHQVGYPGRTEWNVVAGEGTLVVAANFNSPGIKLTRNLNKKYQKPYLQIPPSIEHTAEIVEWLIKNDISILNVAGNRDKETEVGPIHNMTYCIMTLVFAELERRGFLVRAA
jgi:hypothetical protein